MARHLRLETTLAALAVTGMVVCLAAAGVSFGEMLVPGWKGDYLAIACALASIEAFGAYRLYRAYHLYVTGGMKYRLAELFVLLVSFEIVTDLVTGHAPIEHGFPRIDWPGLLLFIPVFLCWRVATNTAADLDIVQREAANVAGSMAPKAGGTRTDEIRSPMELVTPAVRSMLQRFFAGGLALFIVAGLSQTQNARTLHVQRPDLAGPLINVLIYFALGIGMMALLRYGTLSVQWAAGRRVVSGDLAGRWLRYACIFLLGGSLLAFVLPTSYGMDALGAARAGLENALSTLGVWIGNLMQTFGMAPQNTSKYIPKHRHYLPPRATAGHGHPPPASHPLDLNPLLLIRAVLFWLAAAAVVVYVIGTVRREQGGRVVPFRIARVFGWFARLWRAFRGRVQRMATAARSRDRKQVSPALSSAVAISHRRFLGMSPRERVVYYFLSIARRLEGRGARRPSQTALELEAQVTPDLGDAAPDMRTLTQAYLEARYSTHRVGEAEEHRARTSWKQLRSALRKGGGSYR